MRAFAELSADEQDALRAKQRDRKLRKQQTRQEWRARSEAGQELKAEQPSEGCELLRAVASYPDRITSHDYFEACPGGRFRDPSLPPTQEALALLMSILEAEDRQGPAELPTELNTCCYFQFSGAEDDLWDPVFNARLAWEGFFTITSYSRAFRGAEPLPELQPYYGVVTWPNFLAAKQVRAQISKLSKMIDMGASDKASGSAVDDRSSRRRLRLVDSVHRRECWEQLESYHLAQNGSNWLTERYFNMLAAASDNPHINFRMHAICLVEDEEAGQDQSSGAAVERPQPRPTILAGEIGFSVGRIYTSLSGWTAARSSEAHGTSQLVLLGLWLKRKGFAFWSLGHCYSPQLEYKRALGHRILPRWDFVRLLRRYRGDFSSRRECGYCGAVEDPEAKKLQACARCGAVSYCGRECQMADWKKGPIGHKRLCVEKPKQPQEIPAPPAVQSSQAQEPMHASRAATCEIAFEPIAMGESISAAELLQYK